MGFRKRVTINLMATWGDHVIGWGNLSQQDGALFADFGFVKEQPSDREFKRELDDEVERMRRFLGPRVSG